jgi:hypothetical protein
MELLLAVAVAACYATAPAPPALGSRLRGLLSRAPAGLLALGSRRHLPRGLPTASCEPCDAAARAEGAAKQHLRVCKLQGEKSRHGVPLPRSAHRGVATPPALVAGTHRKPAKMPSPTSAMARAMENPVPVSRSLIAQKDARRGGRRRASASASTPSRHATHSGTSDTAGMVSSLDLGGFVTHSRRSWDVPDEEAEALRRRKLKGCPGPLPDAAKFGMYQDLGLSDKGLDKTIQRFVQYWPEGAAKTHGPCFRFRTGANMYKLTEHWPACPTKHGAEALPAPQDQLVQHVGDLMDAMQERCGSAREPWPLDTHGFPDWNGVTDGLRGPPGKAFYPVHPSDVEHASDLATRELASKLMYLLEQPESRMGSVGAALRIVAQSEEGEELGITGRSVMAKFLRRRAEPNPDARTGGVHATNVPGAAGIPENAHPEALWTDEDETELAWVEERAEQATAALGELYQRKMRAIREGGVRSTAAGRGEPAGADDSTGVVSADDGRERRRQELQRRRHQTQRPSSAAAALSMGISQPSTWQKEYGETPPSVNKALLETRAQRGAAAWASVRHIAGVGGAPLDREQDRKQQQHGKSRSGSRPRSPGSPKSPTEHSSSSSPRAGGASNRPSSASPRSAKSDQSRGSSASTRTSRAATASPQRGSRAAKPGQNHGSTAEEEEQLDATLEDMFDIDASRTFFMNRIPRVLTPGASYFDRSEGTVMPTPLEVFHNSRSWQEQEAAADGINGSSSSSASMSLLRQRPQTASASSSSHRRSLSGGGNSNGNSFLAPTASSKAHLSGRGIAAQKRRGKRGGGGGSVQVSQSVSASTLQLGTEDLTTGEDVQVSGSFWELYDDTGAAEKEVVGPEPAGTQSSRHGFLAGESSWSNRSSTLGLPPGSGGNGRGGKAGPQKQKQKQKRGVVRNSTLEDAARRAAAEERFQQQRR